MATSKIPLSGQKLLWTNSNASSSFSAQTIAVPTGPFDAFIIEFRNGKTSTSYTTYVIVKGNFETCFEFNLPDGSQNSVTFRSVFAANDTVSIQDCQYKDFSSSTRTINNDYMIPNRIFGIVKQ